MKKGTIVIYVDPAGKEHEALVKALNGLNEGFITVTYVDVDAPEADNLKTIFDIAHMSDKSKKEPNSGLPTIHLNCWKLTDEAHVSPTSDHPMFDNPFAPKELDQDGNLIPPSRPEYDAQVAAHLDGKPSSADLDAVAEEEEAKEATKGKNGKPKPIAVGK